MARLYNEVFFTILSGQSLCSEPKMTGAGIPSAVIMPASWTVADITFQGSQNGVNFYDLHEPFNAAEVKVNVTAGKMVAIEGAAFAGVRFLKVRSGTAAVPVNQAGDRLLTFICRKELTR